jgi:hypothetical protein
VEACSVPDHGKGITANSIGGWLKHGQSYGGGYGRIHGVSTPPEHTQSGLSGQRLAGRNDTVSGQHRHTLRGEGIGLKIYFHQIISLGVTPRVFLATTVI